MNKKGNGLDFPLSDRVKSELNGQIEINVSQVQALFKGKEPNRLKQYLVSKIPEACGT